SAWDVQDGPARDFAVELYASLLGMTVKRALDGSFDFEANREDGPQPMYRAMRRARRKLLYELSGVSTWGAYQHYGDPYLRLFDPDVLRTATPPESEDDDEDRPRETREAMMPPPPE